MELVVWRSKKFQLINEDSSCPGEVDDTAPIFLFANLISTAGGFTLLLFYLMLVLEDFAPKGVDNDKLPLVGWLVGWLVGGEIDDENNFRQHSNTGK